MLPLPGYRSAHPGYAAEADEAEKAANRAFQIGREAAKAKLR